MAVKRLRVAVIFVVMFLTLYPAAELTRCIVQYNIQPMLEAQATGAVLYFLSPWAKVPTLNGFYMELALMWGAYICVPVVLWIAFKLFYYAGKT